MSDKASEFITLMTTAKELINDAFNQANSAAGIADEAADLFAQGGNANSHAQMTQAAESARKFYNSTAGLVSIADEAITQAQQAKGDLHGSSAGSHTPPPFQFEVVAAPPDEVPPAVHEPTAKIGDPAQPPQGGPDGTSAFRAEVASTDDGDVTKNRRQKFGRSFIRNTSGLNTQAEDTATSSASLTREPEPPGPGQTYETSTAEPPQPSIQSAQVQAGPTDIVGFAVVITAVLIEGVGRVMGKRSR